MRKSSLRKDCPQNHPAVLSKDYSKRHFIFCDDSDDRFENHYPDGSELPKDLSRRDYITWASILIRGENIEGALSDIKFVKAHWSIGKIHFSHEEGESFRHLLYGNDLFRKSFFEFIESLKGHYYFSSILNNKKVFDSILPKVLEDFQLIDEDDWRDPKFASLYWHLMKMDRFLPESDSEYFAYSDRVSAVDKKIDWIAGWYGKPHHHLHKINGLVCFKTDTSDRDEMSVFLEVADFVSSSVRRSFQGIRAQDARVLDLSDEEISKRIASVPSSSEQALIRFTLEMARTNRFQLLDAIICGSASDGSPIKL